MAAVEKCLSNCGSEVKRRRKSTVEAKEEIGHPEVVTVTARERDRGSSWSCVCAGSFRYWAASRSAGSKLSSHEDARSTGRNGPVKMTHGGCSAGGSGNAQRSAIKLTLPFKCDSFDYWNKEFKTASCCMSTAWTRKVSVSGITA